MKDTSGEKIPFITVGITPLILMLRKASNFHFKPKRRYMIVASRKVEIPNYRGSGRQRGRRFGELAQIIWRTAILFLRKCLVPAAKRVGANLLEVAAPEDVEVVSGSKNFKTAAKSGKTDPEKIVGWW